MDSIGMRIKNLRLDNHYTQEKLGKLIGKSKGNISGYEKGTFEPSASTIVLLSKCFNISTDYLLIGTDQSNDVCNFTKAESHTIQKFLKLNDTGKDKAEAYIDGLLSSDKFVRNENTISEHEEMA